MKAVQPGGFSCFARQPHTRSPGTALRCSFGASSGLVVAALLPPFAHTGARCRLSPRVPKRSGICPPRSLRRDTGQTWRPVAQAPKTRKAALDLRAASGVFAGRLHPVVHIAEEQPPVVDEGADRSDIAGGVQYRHLRLYQVANRIQELVPMQVGRPQYVLA